MLAMVQSKFGSFACSRRGEGVSALPFNRGRENKRWGGILFAAAAILGASLSPARADADHAAIAKASLTQVIRPGYAAFADATGAVGDKLAALCQQPSSDALNQAKDAFAGAVAAWSKVEIIRFGPVIEDHRFERLFFWPDPKGIGLRQIQDALAKQDAAVTEPDQLAGKSVALQGLPALEYLLYGDGADALAATAEVEDGQQPLPDLDGPAQLRCSFASSVATNIDRAAKAVVEGWRDGSAYEKAFLGPAPDDPYYHAPKEVTLDLFKTFTTGIELVRDQKLGKPLGANPAEAKPKLAAFWRSGLSFANAAGNLEGVKAVFAQGGFAEVVAAESAGVENSILFDLDHAIEALRGIDQPIAEVLKNEDLRAKLEALRVGLKNSAQTAGDMISRGAGLAFGFNAMDGD
jgi:predicted lipoprotein